MLRLHIPDSCYNTVSLFCASSSSNLTLISSFTPSPGSYYLNSKHVKEICETFYHCVSQRSDSNVKKQCSLCTPQYKQPVSFHPTCSLLTCHGKAAQCTGPSLGLTHPLLAALSGHLDPAWHGAVWSRQHNIHVAA